MAPHRRRVTTVAAAGAAAAVAIATGAHQAGATCSFTQTCTSGQDNCTPVPVSGAAAEPFPFDNSTTPNPLVCPQYANSLCCTGKQNDALFGNFGAIKSGYLTLGGNDACVANLYSLWCAFTCAPNQADFVVTAGFTNMTDPLNPGSTKEYPVLLSTIYLDAYFACGLWESCRSTGTTQLLGEDTCESFLLMQAAHAVTAGGSYTSFQFSTATNGSNVATLTANGLVYKKPRPVLVEAPATTPGGARTVMHPLVAGAAVAAADDDSGGATNAVYLSVPLYDCCSAPSIDYYPWPAPASVGNVTALCTTCAGMCGDAGETCYTNPFFAGNDTIDPNLDAVNLSPWYGLDWQAIAALWGVVIAVTIAMQAYGACVRMRAAAKAADLAGGATAGAVPYTPPRNGSLDSASRATMFSMPFMRAPPAAPAHTVSTFASPSSTLGSEALLSTSLDASGGSMLAPSSGGARMTSPDAKYYRR